jgi:hypothetical protein
LNCGSCDFREKCYLIRMVDESDAQYKNGNIDGLLRSSEILRLHENHLAELRKDIALKLADLTEIY